MNRTTDILSADCASRDATWTEFNMLFRLFLILTLLPLIELWLLTKFSGQFGFGTTLLMIFGTGALGAALSKQQGLKAWHAIQEQSRHGQIPADAMFDGVIIFVAGLLLITPGVLTDILGVLLLIPLFRRFVKMWLIAEFKRRAVFQVTSVGGATSWSASVGSAPRSSTDDIIDAEFERHASAPETVDPPRLEHSP